MDQWAQMRPRYPWKNGEILIADELNAAIANAQAFGATYTLRAFGSQNDGVTDDSFALNAAIAAICALPCGGKLLIPDGRTMIGSAIRASIPAGVTLTIEGMGPNASQLYFPNATDGLSFMLLNSNYAWGAVSLHGFSLIRGPTVPAIANTALNIYADPTVAQACGSGGSFRDLIIAGSSWSSTSTLVTNQWKNSMILNGTGGCSLSNITMRGNDSVSVDSGDALLQITGTLTGPPGPPPTFEQFATNNNIVNSTLQGGSVGLLISGYVQGVAITNTTIIGDYDGVRWIGGPGLFAESLNMVNVNCNAVHRGVYLSQTNACTIFACVILHFNPQTGVSWAGIEFNQLGFNTAIGNSIVGAFTGTEDGIVVSDCSNNANTIVGNSTTHLVRSGIRLAGTTNGTTVTGNTLTGGIGLTQDTQGNTIIGNTWDGIPTPNHPLQIFADGLNCNGPLLTLSGIQLQSITPGNNLIFFEAGGIGPPSFTTQSIGTKITLFPVLDSTHVDYGIGYDANTLWMSVAQNVAADIFAWYGGTTQVAALDGTGVLTIAGQRFSALPANATNDAAAATAGVPIRGVYRNGSALMVRVA